MFFANCSLLGFFCSEIIIRKKKWSNTEQASNETVAKKKTWRYLLANPDRYTNQENMSVSKWRQKAEEMAEVAE